MKLKHLFFYCPLFLINTLSFAQNNIVHVNQATGAANVTIPLYTINAAHVSLPITLFYSATGLRIDDVEGTAGVGWNLVAGGSITRQVRGLPDDIQTDNAGRSLSGWMSNTVETALKSHTFANLGANSTCTDETTDINYINQNFYASTVPMDTEPDIFSVNAPGLSCQLVFDSSTQTFQPIPYQDLQISYVKNSTNGILSFTITNDQGIAYSFATPETSFQQASNPPLTASQYFALAHNQYSGGVTYYSAWDLTSIADTYNNSIQLSYIQGSKKGYSNPVQVVLNEGSSLTTLYTITGATTPNLVSQIHYSDGVNTTLAFNITYNTNTVTQKSYVAAIGGLGRNFQFSYNYVIANYPSNTKKFGRYFLNSVTDGDCSSPFYYSFTYNGSSGLPDSTSTGVDFYGYYNGYSNNISLIPNIEINPSTSGYDRYRNSLSEDINLNVINTVYPVSINNYTDSREPNAGGIGGASYGTLSQITYADGGYTSFLFEPNNYYDKVIRQNIPGSGIRITQIQDNDGSKTITKNYSYIDPATGFSSGQPVSLPIFAFTTPYTGSATTTCNGCQIGPNADLWAYSTVRSVSDLSSEDHTVYYSSVTETQTGAGYTVYHFVNPATYGSAAITGPLAWSPTVSDFGRMSIGSTCPTIGFLRNDTYTYPFPPSPNYDFERGLVSQIANFNDNGQKVSEVDYTYSTPETPNIITALKYDFFSIGSYGNPISYATYPIYTGAGPLLIQKTSEVFDLTAGTNVPLTTGQTTTINYKYNGLLHKQPTQIAVLNSDGTLQTTNIVYAKDYVIPYNTTYNTYLPGDSYATAIQSLQYMNINVPVEKYFQVTTNGSSTPTTTGGELTEYGVFNLPAAKHLTEPVTKLKFIATNGTSAVFQPSSINSSTAKFQYDPNYVFVTENDLAYDYSGYLLSSDDGFKNIQTTLIDHNTFQPKAFVKGAMYTEIAIDDFDSKTSANAFTVSTSGSTAAQTINYSVLGRSGAGAMSFGQGVTLSTSLSKNVIASNYTLSLWVKSAAAGQIDVKVAGNVTNNAVCPYGNTSATPTGWQYVQVPLSLTGITSATFTVSLTLDATLSTQNITVDDILCYPDIAEINTFAYDPTTHYKTTETNTNGISKYYTIDQFGRTHYIYDQDKNILLRNTYTSLYNIQQLNNSPQSFSWVVTNGNQYTFTNTTFQSACATPPAVTRWAPSTGGYFYTYGNAPFTYTYTGTQKSFQVCMQPNYTTGGTDDLCQTVTIP